MLTDLYLFQPTTAPGREGPAPAPAQPSQGAPAGEAPSPPGFTGTTLLLFLLPILLIFFMTRSQNKKQKDLETNLKAGDRVITRGGMVGRVIEVGDRLKVEIAPGVNVMMVRSAIEGIDGGEKAADPKKDKDADSGAPTKDKSQEKKG